VRRNIFDHVLNKYVHYHFYPRAKDAFIGLAGNKLAIPSNGGGDMLAALVRRIILA